MTRYTVSHWGIYEYDETEEAPRLRPLRSDPDPSMIGLYQLDPKLLESRIKRPSIRRSWLQHGPGAHPELRGKEPFVEVEWELALDLISAELKRVKREYGNSAIFGGSYGWASAGRFHHAQSQVHRFLNCIGGYVRHTGSYSLGAAHVILPHIAGTVADLSAEHTTWDVLAEHTELFVTFGGVPTKNAQSSPGGAGHHRVGPGLKAMAEKGVRFVNIGPCNDNIAAECKAEWIRCRPNSDVALMLALAWQLVEDDAHDQAFLRRYTVGFEKFLPYLLGDDDGVAKTPAWAAELTGVQADRIVSLARQMARSRTMVNIAWSLQRAHHGEQAFWMAITLAAMIGQIGLPGGGFGVGYGPMNANGSPHRRLSGPTLSQGRNAVQDYIPCARIADMLLNPGATFEHDGALRTYPDIQLIYWAGGNPYHHHQDLNRLNRAWQKPQTIIVHDPFWTASAKRADIALPVTTAMERNDIGYATQEGFLVAMRQIVEPFGDARSDYQIFASLANRMGVGEQFTEGRDDQAWLSHIYEETREHWLREGIKCPDFETFWEQGLIDLAEQAKPRVMFEDFRNAPEAHPLTTPSGRIEIFSETIASFNLPDCKGHPAWFEPREWLGTAGPGMLHLLTDQPARKLHSQLDASPYSAAGKVNGRECIYMNPADAETRGLSQNDTVEVWNRRGRCLASVSITDEIMQGVVRISTGAWYDPDERGCDLHGNPNVLTLDIGTSSLGQGCAAQTCLVSLRGPLRNAPEPNPFRRPQLVP
ncbi:MULTISPECIES: molybdopterin guanine dinucleotide-containing S/N-oxide reductase [Chelativorans]|jgi:biotin/methionine sulfoxide reductase|uniref:Molybdopterin oxidoreductase n=1 Tax=Chelativorans sp. (strain BNC1) TaxID=266779 RepID=Q11C95_CHESB|nr:MULTISPECIES: molybdopterin guanine dinucleotide-containing S/N-oxide reductase [Chelativorans]